MKRFHLEILPPDEDRHAEEMFDLIAKVFSPGPGYYGALGTLGDKYIRNGSYYDWKASRIGFINGRIVTHFGVWGYRMRIGASRVRVGGIGAVATHGHYRRLGLMAETTNASIQAMRDSDYDLSILFGIDNFYHKHGYARAWCSTTYSVRTGNLPADRSPFRISQFVPKHREDLADLYNREHATFTGTAVRPTYLVNRWPTQTGYLWRDGKGMVAGYVLVDRNEEKLRAIEACGDPGRILQVTGRLARRGGYREVHFSTIPHGSELCKRIRRGNSRMEVGNRLSGGPMVRIVNLVSTLTKMRREFSIRLRNSHLSNWNGKLTLADGREEATLAIEGSRVEVTAPQKTPHSIRGGNELASLLIGTDEPLETVESGRMRLSGEAKALVRVLFPNEHPVLSSRDGF